MPGAQKIARERVVTEMEIKVRLTLQEAEHLLRVLDLAESMIDHYEADGGLAGAENGAASSFARDLRTALKWAIDGEPNTKEM